MLSGSSDLNSAVLLPCAFQTLTTTNTCPLQTRLPLIIPSPSSSSLLGNSKLCITPFDWSSACIKMLLMTTFKSLLDCLCPAVDFSAHVRETKVPHKKQGLWSWHIPELLRGGFIPLFTWTEWSVTVSQPNVTLVILSSDPDPQILIPAVHPRAGLPTSRLFHRREGNCLSPHHSFYWFPTPSEFEQHTQGGFPFPSFYHCSCCCHPALCVPRKDSPFSSQAWALCDSWCIPAVLFPLWASSHPWDDIPEACACSNVFPDYCPTGKNLLKELETLH